MRLIFLFLLITAFIATLLYSKNSRTLSKSQKIFKLNKKNLNTWMNFSKKERYELSKKDSINYINQRKNLLKQIRNEYKNISSSEK